MNQNHFLNAGDIILFTDNNNILQPAVVCRQIPGQNSVLVSFINHNVFNSQLNYREQFGTNIVIVPGADNYIPYMLQDVLRYTNFNRLHDLQNRYNELLEQINTGNLMLLGHVNQGGQQKRRKSRILSNRRMKKSRQRKY